MISPSQRNDQATGFINYFHFTACLLYNLIKIWKMMKPPLQFPVPAEILRDTINTSGAYTRRIFRQMYRPQFPCPVIFQERGITPTPSGEHSQDSSSPISAHTPATRFPGTEWKNRVGIRYKKERKAVLFLVLKQMYNQETERDPLATWQSSKAMSVARPSAPALHETGTVTQPLEGTFLLL